MGRTRPLFVLFSFFSHDKYSTNTIYEKSIDGVLGTRTWGGRMVGADESTEIWRHPFTFSLQPISHCYLLFFFLISLVSWIPFIYLCIPKIPLYTKDTFESLLQTQCLSLILISLLLSQNIKHTFLSPSNLILCLSFILILLSLNPFSLSLSLSQSFLSLSLSILSLSLSLFQSFLSLSFNPFSLSIFQSFLSLSFNPFSLSLSILSLSLFQSFLFQSFLSLSISLSFSHSLSFIPFFCFELWLPSGRFHATVISLCSNVEKEKASSFSSEK